MVFQMKESAMIYVIYRAKNGAPSWLTFKNRQEAEEALRDIKLDTVIVIEGREIGLKGAFDYVLEKHGYEVDSKDEVGSKDIAHAWI